EFPAGDEIVHGRGADLGGIGASAETVRGGDDVVIGRPIGQAGVHVSGDGRAAHGRVRSAAGRGTLDVVVGGTRSRSPRKADLRVARRRAQAGGRWRRGAGAGHYFAGGQLVVRARTQRSEGRCVRGVGP